MHSKSYEPTLPPAYRAVKTVDAMATRFAILMNAAALLVMIVLGIAMIFIRGGVSFTLGTEQFMGRMFLFSVALIVVLIVHELLHGLAYKLLTKHKLSFGLSWSCAYCGVPDIYVYRPTALIALLTPFTVFTVLFLAGMLIAPVGTMFWDIWAWLFVMHTGGCVGDLYDTWLYVAHFRGNDTLMRDTGPAQTFYVKEKEVLEGER